MKKILFNDRYCLTNAVIKGYKTMTRRVMNSQTPIYKEGEIVAVAQKYGDIIDMTNAKSIPPRAEHRGWDNKLYVKAELMPHQIRITKVRMKRMRDVSSADCMKEGIRWDANNNNFFYFDKKKDAVFHSDTAVGSYSNLITKICGKDAWISNAPVWEYEFELVK